MEVPFGYGLLPRVAPLPENAQIAYQSEASIFWIFPLGGGPKLGPKHHTYSCDTMSVNLIPRYTTRTDLCVKATTGLHFRFWHQADIMFQRREVRF